MFDSILTLFFQIFSFDPPDPTDYIKRSEEVRNVLFRYNLTKKFVYSKATNFT